MIHVTGTVFTPLQISSEEELRVDIIANFSPPIVQASQLSNAADKLLELYPDVPALGSPFNTGNETFGLSSQYKRAAALRMSWFSLLSNDVDPTTNRGRYCFSFPASFLAANCRESRSKDLGVLVHPTSTRLFPLPWWCVILHSKSYTCC